MQPVLANLFISSWYTITTAGVLEKDGITHILSVMTGIADSPLLESYKRMIIEVNDDPDEPLINYFESAIQWIDDAMAEGGKVVVHWYRIPFLNSAYRSV
jgi:Dual specificity phosphatase, catalytic domain